MRRLLCFIGLALLVLVIAAPSARADTLFNETFDNYTFSTIYFLGFPIGTASSNDGLPLVSEGADETWSAGRFDNQGTSGLDGELKVNRDGHGSGNHSAQFEDDAGLLFNVSTVGYTSADLSFDWKTSSVSGSDRVRAGYFTGSLSGSGPYYNLNGAWSSWTELNIGNGTSSSWASSGPFTLPVDQASLWVAFWIDDGNGDNGHLDNVLVSGTPTPPPPPPPTTPMPLPAPVLIGGVMLVGLGLNKWRKSR
jgi:hypothetical protein